MAKKTAGERLWKEYRKKVRTQRLESELLLSSETLHQYLLDHPQVDFDVPDNIYVPWVKAIKELGGKA